jgi:hypothetical protein
MSSLNFPETVESEFEADYWPPDRRASACSLPCHVAIPSSELNLEFPNDVYSVAGARKVCAFWTHLDEALGKEEAREMFDLTTARYTVRDDDVCARCIPDCVVTGKVQLLLIARSNFIDLAARSATKLLNKLEIGLEEVRFEWAGSMSPNKNVRSYTYYSDVKWVKPLE